MKGATIMPDISKMEKPARRVLNVFYILDTSGSMSGTSIATLNRAMEETIDALKKQAKSNADALVKVSVMQFSTGCSWLQPDGPEELDEDFIWEDLQAGGLTDMGEALSELNKRLSRKEYLNSITGNYLPVIIFMTDGYATDDYDKPLARIRQNKWFRRATKIGFAIGDDPDMQMICEVVGNNEAVVRTTDLQLFAKLIKFASLTSSMLASKSQTTDTGTSGASIIQSAIQSGDAPADIIDTDVDYDPEPEPTASGSNSEWDDDDEW